MAIAERGRLLRLPASKARELLQVQEAMDRLAQQLVREPTVEELADHLGLAFSVVRELLGLRARPLSLNAPLEIGKHITLMEVLSDQEAGL